MRNRYNTSNHVILNLNTLGSGCNSIITSLSLVRFNPYTGEVFERVDSDIDLDSSIQMGIDVSGKGILWWMEQSDLVRYSLINGQEEASDPLDSMLEVSSFLSHLEIVLFTSKERGEEESLIVWTEGSQCSSGILSNYFQLLGMEIPFALTNVRDVNTIVEFAPEVKESCVFEGTRNIPYFEALHQIKYLSKTLQYIFESFK